MSDNTDNQNSEQNASQSSENELTTAQSVNSSVPTVKLEDELKQSFIDYAMSVIVDRALPDVRDGLKPVHRRVLFDMYDLKVWSTGQTKSQLVLLVTLLVDSIHMEILLYTKLLFVWLNGSQCVNL